MADGQTVANVEKRCFVTIGATAPFNRLVQAVLDAEFVLALRRAGYTELRVQYGNHEGEAIFNQRKPDLEPALRGVNFRVSGFGFHKTGLRDEMIAVKSRSKETEGMIISHAGSGSILDAFRVGVPLVVVPNTDLLHNHQVELAEVLAEQDYVVYGQLEYVYRRLEDLSTFRGGLFFELPNVIALPSSIAQIENLRSRMKQWPPARSGEQQPRRGLADVMAEEMGWQLD